MSNWSTLVIVSALVFFISGYSFSSKLINNTNSVEFDTEIIENEGSEARSLNIKIYNQYTENDPVTDYPWDIMAEPHRASTFKITDGHINGATYAWYMKDVLLGTDESIEHTFTKTGKHNIILIQTLTDGTEISTTFEVMVKYVRREIRSLTDYDRESYFSAVSMLQRIPTHVGQKIWGSKYKSKDYFNRLHLYYGGSMDCDHWHQGAGFVTSHIAFTLEFEQALQSIIPSVTVPYWDFTLESTFYGSGDWRSSPVFSEDWFGEAAPDNELRTPTSGRFAFVPALTHAENFSRVLNSYGLLRAPWNNDPTPYVTRSSEIYGYENNLKPSGCSEYHRSLKKTDWMSMAKQLNSAAHGHIHELVGGSWNSHYADELGLDSPHPAVLTFSHEIQAMSKELWRNGYITCPEHCSMDTPSSECMCQCTEESLAGKSAYEILDDAKILASAEYFDAENHLISSWYDENGSVYYTLPNYSAEESQHIYETFLHHLCDPGHIGTMFQATSSNDITFWTLHGALDRLWHWKRLANDPDYDETWEDVHPCYGHNSMDFQPFKKLFGEDETDYYTNIQLYGLLHPSTDSMPYVYDNFRWPHCEMQGYDMHNI